MRRPSGPPPRPPVSAASPVAPQPPAKKVSSPDGLAPRAPKQLVTLDVPVQPRGRAYETVGLGGVQDEFFEAVLRRPAGWLAIGEHRDREAVWGTIQATLQAGLPSGAATASTTACSASSSKAS